MAKNIKGIIIELGAETKGLDKALADVNKQSRDIQKELREVNKLLKFNPKDTELLSQKQKLLGDQVSATKEKLDKLKAAEAQVQEQFKKGEITEEQYRAYQREIVETESKLKHYEEQLKQVTRENNSFAQSMETASKKLKDVGGKMESVGKDLNKKVTLPIVGVGVAAAKMGMDFDGAMANIGTLIPQQGERLNELKGQIQDVAITTGKSTDDIADGTYNVISAFGDAADTMDKVEINAKAAKAGLAETSDALNLSSSVMKGFGDTSAEANEKVMDLAFNTVKLGQTSFKDLASSIGKVVPTTNELKISQEEMFAVFATGTGVTGNASEVSTQYQGVLKALMAPTKEMTKLMEEMGYEDGKAMIAKEGLGGAIQTIVNKSKETGEPLQKYIGSIQGQVLALALAGEQSDVYANKLEQLKNSSGAMEEAFKEQTEGINATGFTFEQAMRKMQVAGQKMGDTLAPMLAKVADIISSLTDKLLEMDDGTRKVVVVIAGLAAAIGPLLIIGGKMATGIGSIIGLGAKLAPAIGAVNLKFLAIAGPIAAAIAVGVLLYKNWDKIKEKAGQLKDAVGEKWDNIKTKTSETWDNMKTTTKDKWDELKKKTSDTAENIRETVGDKWDNIKKKTSDTWENMKTNTADAWSNIKSTIEENGGGIEGILNTAVKGYASIWQTGFNLIDKVTGGKMSDIANSINIGLGNVKSFFNNLKLKPIEIPKPKLPHFSISGEFSLKPPSVPHINVDWYKTGAVFNGPQVIGVGEAGPEAVIPIEKLGGILADTLKKIDGDRNSKTVVEKEKYYQDKGITQHIIINSPTPLTPSETARQVKNASRNLALEW